MLVRLEPRFRSWLHHRRLRQRRGSEGFTVLVEAHQGDGAYLVPAVQSAQVAAQPLLEQGIPVDLILLLDHVDRYTSAVARQLSREPGPLPRALISGVLGDPLKARQRALRQARLPWVALLQGRNLWAANWLEASQAALVRSDEPTRTVVHPRWSLGFQSSQAIQCCDQSPWLIDPVGSLQMRPAWLVNGAAHRDLWWTLLGTGSPETVHLEQHGIHQQSLPGTCWFQRGLHGLAASAVSRTRI